MLLEAGREPALDLREDLPLMPVVADRGGLGLVDLDDRAAGFGQRRSSSCSASARASASSASSGLVGRRLPGDRVRPDEHLLHRELRAARGPRPVGDRDRTGPRDPAIEAGDGHRRAIGQRRRAVRRDATEPGHQPRKSVGIAEPAVGEDREPGRLLLDDEVGQQRIHDRVVGGPIDLSGREPSIGLAEHIRETREGIAGVVGGDGAEDGNAPGNGHRAEVAPLCAMGGRWSPAPGRRVRAARQGAPGPARADPGDGTR